MQQAALESSYGTAYDVPSGDAFYSLAKLRTQFQDYVFQKNAEVQEQKESRRYYNCVQWTAEQIKLIKSRGQPVTTKNEYARKVNAIVGVLERLKQDPKAYPNSPQHAEGADLATETLRYALNSQHWDAIQPTCARNGAIDGIAGVEFDITQGDEGDPEIGIAPVQPDTFFYDPRSFEDDFSDALFMGTSKWIDRDVLKDMFPDKAEDIDAMSANASEYTLDSDREVVWNNSKDNTVRAVDHWYLCKGQWKWCFHVGGTKLAEGVSPWIDEKNKTLPKYCMYSANVDHEGDRYGFLRNLKTPCDEVNQRTSRLLHISNSRRLILEEGAVKSIEVARREWTRADGVVVVHPGRMAAIQPDNTQQDFQGQLLLLQEAKQDLDKFGPNAAQLGQGDASKSGRAIALLQQAGLAELGPFMIAFRNWKFRVYRMMWNAIQRYWQKERWIRVTDSEGLTQFIQLNGLALDQFGRPALVNALGSLDVDIVLDESGDIVSTMQEALETLQSALAAGMPIPPDILVDLLPIRQDIKKRLKERMEQAQKPDPMQEQAKRVALDQEQAKTGKYKADTFKATADAVTKLAPMGMGGVSGMGRPQPQTQMPQMGGPPMPMMPPPPQAQPAFGGGGTGGLPIEFAAQGRGGGISPSLMPQAPMPAQHSFGF